MTAYLPSIGTRSRLWQLPIGSRPTQFLQPRCHGGQMRVATIDIGTNSIHMIVVEIGSDRAFEVIDREKLMVRLGGGGLDGRALTDTAMGTALQALSRFRRLAEAHKVDEIVASATSAVREADNAPAFLERIERETGVRVKVISSTEEARLIHFAAAYGVDMSGGDAVVIDIGGGSVEITLGSATHVTFARSFKIGVIRLTDRFVQADPLSASAERKLAKHIEREVAEYLDDLMAHGFDQVIGTSGTILSLGGIIAGTDDLRNHRVTAAQVHGLRQRLVSLDLEARLRIPRLDPRRGDLIVAGSVLLDTILQRLGATEMTLCDMALREGLVLDYIERNQARIDKVERYPEVRRRSVIELAERCHYSPPHAQQVAKLALALFDQTRSAHGLTDRERDWLEYAALLHDIGVHISYNRHHRHSYYLIKNGDLRGFAPEEVETIALVARYHRRGTPKRSHEGYGDLPGSLRRTVKLLGAILRLAEGLDRSHAQSVADVTLLPHDGHYLLHLRPGGDVELELWAAHRHAAPLEEILERMIRFEIDGTYAEHTDHATPISGHADRRRGHRRLRQDHPARPARQVAGRRRTSRVRH